MEKVVKVRPKDLPTESRIMKEEFASSQTPILETDMSPKNKNQKPKIFAIFAIVVLLGVATGYGASKVVATPGTLGSSTKGAAPVKNSSTEAGITDDSAFPDTAEGTLVEGGIDGEGTHHLDRGLGKDKYVYLTSTVINLESFVGKKVEVHGQTMSGKKAGWLMDVGRIKVLE